MMHCFLGLEVWKRIDDIFLSQRKYTDDILNKFGMLNSNPMATKMVMNRKKLSVSSSNFAEIHITLYIKSIRSLMYMVNTRPDIFYVVSALSQFMNQLRQTHQIIVKHLLRYL
jgi:hypothetical protein